MKIKCPSCNWEDDNVINWTFHVEKHPYKALANYFHLLVKIHEKIEELKIEKKNPEHFSPVESQLMMNVLNWVLEPEPESDK